MTTTLPQPPDFSALDEVAAKSADQRTRVLALIGNLVFAWSNNESMFIYILMILLRSDLQSAAVVFITLNTTRARLDLIRRLAKTQITDARALRRLERMIDRFNDCTKVRNEFNHCVYDIDADGGITHTSVLRMRETRTGIAFEERRPFDDKRVREVAKTIKALTQLNREIWTFLPELASCLEPAPERNG